ncbi:hypothetical protein ANO11243_076490 [Dothideomycetidae sp. 11243]|nr:hypothetical protein ANO11243_076490 [fungal sp. No.11243]
MADSMRKQFLNGAPKNEAKVIKEFVTNRTNKENALKVRPQGYDKDHADIALLKLRNFTLGHKFADSEVTKATFSDTVVDLMRVLHPFVKYLNSVVMPDPDDEEEGEDEDEDEDEDEEDEDEDEDDE